MVNDDYLANESENVNTTNVQDVDSDDDSLPDLSKEKGLKFHLVKKRKLIIVCLPLFITLYILWVHA